MCNKTFFRLFVLLACLTQMSCDNTPRCTVSGTITQAADSVLYLEHATLDGLQRVDSATLAPDGAFTFSTPAPTGCPEFYTLRIGRHIINFALDTLEHITIQAALPDMESAYTITGNESCAKMKEISLLQQQVQARLMTIERNDDLLPGDMADSVESVISAYKDDIKRRYIFQNPQSAYAYYAVCQNLTDQRGTFLLFNPVADRADVKCYATVATAWDGRWPDAPRTIQLCNMAIQGMSNTAQPTVMQLEGSKVAETGIIDICLPDVNSEMRSVTDLRGKVVMIDFTVYAAKESPERIRKMRTLYEKYRDQGFEIYQISLDDDVHFWKYSSENLPWVCVHETDGTATSTYSVTRVPTFFLVNRDNEVVLRSDFMKSTLEEELLRLL